VLIFMLGVPMKNFPEMILPDQLAFHICRIAAQTKDDTTTPNIGHGEAI
jgi:hypothetical protein